MNSQAHVAKIRGNRQLQASNGKFIGVLRLICYVCGTKAGKSPPKADNDPLVEDPS